MERKELEKALNENIPDISGKNIWIWGAGDTAQLYQEGFRRLEGENFFINGYIDNDPAKIGRDFNGKPVISPDKINEIDNICVLLCSIQQGVVEAVEGQLNELQVEWYLVDDVILKKHRKEVMSCYDLLYDDKSKSIYADLVMWRISGKKKNVATEIGNDYFALDHFLQKNPEEVFVECGAWRGDVVEQYISSKDGLFKKIIAFEPDKISFAALEQTVADLKKKWNLKDNSVQLCQCGVGDENRMTFFDRYEANNGQGSKFHMISNDLEAEKLQMVSLDEYLTEPYSFLKADIESFEYRMLLGAEKGIKKYKPLLTICLYHNAVDFYSIPLLVKSMVPEYKMAVRHHSDELQGTVLYAWI
jgi:FkbM family methyltransferase